MRHLISSFNLSFTLGISFLILSLQGCMVGGTRGTGLSYSGYSEGSPTLLKIRILGSLRNTAGKKLLGVRVTAHTKSGDFSSITDSSGNFAFDLSFESGEAITFAFESKELKGSVVSELSPEGKDEVTLKFVFDKNGKVKLSK